MAVDVCLTCGRPGSVETAVREDIDALGDLSGAQPSLAASALALARSIDTADERNVAALAKELRATLGELMGGRAEPDDDSLGDLGATG